MSNLPSVIRKNQVLLNLVLTHHWYDEVVSGRKRVEYREMSDHWKKLIWDRRQHINRVRFQRAYSKNAPKSQYYVSNIDIGPCPYDGWEGDYYRIHFTEENIDRNAKIQPPNPYNMGCSNCISDSPFRVFEHSPPLVTIICTKHHYCFHTYLTWYSCYCCGLRLTDYTVVFRLRHYREEQSYGDI